MSRKLSNLILVTLLGLGAACGRPENLERRLIDLLTQAQEKSLAFEYVEEFGDRRTEVRGKVEDSIRYSESLIIDGNNVLERIVHDDVLAVQVKIVEHIPQILSPQPPDFGVAEVLKSGQWVIDPSGAPGEGSAGQTTENVGADPLKDAANVFQYARNAIGQAPEVIEFNPNALNYLPEEDPFPAPNEKIDELRYDLIPPPLPRREADPLPGPAAFRKMSIYTVKNRVVRIMEQIDIESQQEIKRALETGRNKFLIKLARDVKAGRTDQKIRERKMSFEILTSRGRIIVAVPSEGFVGNLRVLFGDTAGATPEDGEPPPIPLPGQLPPAEAAGTSSPAAP
jgi:hypothetical protein